VSYFPNPVNDYLNVECDCDGAILKITNINGQEMLDQMLLPKGFSAQVSVENLPDGIYIINGIDSKGNPLFAKKIIKF